MLFLAGPLAAQCSAGVASAITRVISYALAKRLFSWDDSNSVITILFCSTFILVKAQLDLFGLLFDLFINRGFRLSRAALSSVLFISI